MATIYIDNQAYEVKDGQNLLQACLSLGFNVPYFCWHPALQSVGACRQCAVKQFQNENDTVGKIVMACMTPATNGTRISIDDKDAQAFRARMIALYMTNHPHDCPVCDEGGECHLQDMTVMSGHNYREYRFTKRTYNNQNLGPFIHHEMNRCIQCYRCTRFYNNYAGGRDFGPFASHNHVFFGRHEDGALESEFSGNLVEICPTGVFTDKTFKKHHSRAWDLQTATSVCVHCGLGCNVTPGERYGELRRIRNRYNGEVNGYFLCDRGRFGYEFVNAATRVREPLVRDKENNALKAVSKTDALTHVRGLMRNGKVIGIGSPRASLESNYALRALVGADKFYSGSAKAEHALVAAMLDMMRHSPARVPSLREVGEADAVLVLGEDVTNTAPMMALQVYQALYRAMLPEAEKAGIPAWNDAPARELIQNRRGFMAVAALADTKLDAFAAVTHRGAPDDLARLGFAVAHDIDPSAPSVEGLSEEVRGIAQAIAEGLKKAKRPLVITGPSCGSEDVLNGAFNVAAALCKQGADAALSFVMPECNSVGAGLMGGGVLEDAVTAVESGAADTVVILENNLCRRVERAMVDRLLAGAKHVVVLDHTRNAVLERSEAVLPAATFAEGDGTLVNNEGRAQRCIQVMPPQEHIQESWRWLGEVNGTPWKTIDAVQAELTKALPELAGVVEVVPGSDTRFVGQRLPRQPHRYSGRTSMCANINVHEPKIAEDPDSLFTFSMEGFRGKVPGSVIPSYWAPGWNSVQGLSKFQEEVGGALCGGDPGVRLIVSDKKAAYAGNVLVKAEARAGERLVVALAHVFGSDELSALSAPVAERAPKPYVALNPADTAALGVQDGDIVEVTVAGAALALPVQARPGLAAGLVGVPAGVVDVPAAQLPAWGVVKKRIEG